jgi:hypothetical protein
MATHTSGRSGDRSSTAVLDDYFDSITIEQVYENQGWKQIDELPPL